MSFSVCFFSSSETCSVFLTFPIASVRAWRIATRPSSANLCTTFTSSRRRSSLRGGERNPDEVTVVGGGEAQIGREDRLFDRLEEALVPRLDGQELRLGRRHAGDLVERHLAAVGVHAHQIQQRRRRLSRADGGELALHRFYGFVHRVLRLFDVVRERCGGRAHWTMVPTRSPARTLAVAPGWLMLNTTMGSLFSLQRPKAFASITA